MSGSAAASGSIEGFIYTTVPIGEQMKGYFEVVPQVGLFSLLVCQWYAHPKKKWNILSGIVVGIILFLSIMGVLAASGIIQTD